MENIKEKIAALNNANNVIENLACETLNNIMDSLNTDIIVFPIDETLQMNWGTFKGEYTTISRDNERHLVFDMVSSDGTGVIPEINTPRGANVVLALIDHTMTLMEQGVSLVPDLSGFENFDMEVLDKMMIEHTATIVNMF